MKQMNQNRGYNFGAGPAMLPESILCEAQAELLNWEHSGMSIVEISHRSSLFMNMLEETEALFREVLSIPEDYQVLFLTQPARTQFAMIPMNFIHPAVQAAYVVSGVWSYEAYKEATRLSNAYCLATNEGCEYTQLPSVNERDIRDETAYVYYTPNETIDGIRFSTPLKVNAPLIADMTSCLLSEPLNIEQYGLIFAGSQKNIAPAGLTVVIVKNSLLNTISAKLPTMLDYRVHVEQHSLYATPATFQCYMAGKMLQWIKTQGGVESLYAINGQKSELLYQYIDQSSVYKTFVNNKNERSLMNVCFYLQDPAKEDDFIKQASSRGLYGLRGHRRKGGLRASLYNAMPMDGVKSLIEFMQEFAQSNS